MAVTVIGVVVRPRGTFAALAGSPRLALGFAAVVGSGIVALGLGLLANQIGGGGGPGTVASLLLPVLFLVYWGAAALIIDATAGLVGRAGRWRPYLAVSGFTFIPWVAYSLLAVVEAAAGANSAAESALAWLTLPLLAWFLYVTALAVYAVFEVTPFVAVALAMLPDAALLFILIALLVVANA
jgi:Yip1 domain